MIKIMSLIVLTALLFICVCYADTVKGKIDKVDIKAYEIIVNGQKVNVARADVFTENDMNTTKTIIIRDLKDHKGETAICYGSTDKSGIFTAYKVRVIEGHR